MPATPRGTRAARQPRPPVIPDALTAAGPADRELTHDGKYLSLSYGAEPITGDEIEDVEFERCRFERTALSGVRLERAEFNDTAFSGCDLANMRMLNSRLFTSTVANSRLTGLTLTAGGIRDVRFDGCRADMASFRFSLVRDTVFKDCNLTEANFQEAELSNVQFLDCQLAGAQFSDAKMSQVRFRGCHLGGVAGLRSFRGAIVASADAMSLLDALVNEFGITIED